MPKDKFNQGYRSFRGYWVTDGVAKQSSKYVGGSSENIGGGGFTPPVVLKRRPYAMLGYMNNRMHANVVIYNGFHVWGNMPPKKITFNARNSSGSCDLFGVGSPYAHRIMQLTLADAASYGRMITVPGSSYYEADGFYVPSPLYPQYSVPSGNTFIGQDSSPFRASSSMVYPGRVPGLHMQVMFGSPYWRFDNLLERPIYDPDSHLTHNSLDFKLPMTDTDSQLKCYQDCVDIINSCMQDDDHIITSCWPESDAEISTCFSRYKTAAPYICYVPGKKNPLSNPQLYEGNVNVNDFADPIFEEGEANLYDVDYTKVPTFKRSISDLSSTNNIRGYESPAMSVFPSGSSYYLRKGLFTGKTASFDVNLETHYYTEMQSGIIMAPRGGILNLTDYDLPYGGTPPYAGRGRLRNGDNYNNPWDYNWNNIKDKLTIVPPINKPGGSFDIAWVTFNEAYAGYGGVPIFGVTRCWYVSNSPFVDKLVTREVYFYENGEVHVVEK